jgi:multidrug efflux pump subunit AcrB
VNRAIAWFARNHVAANLLMVLLVVGGLLTVPMLGQQMLPDVDLEILTVSVPYPGASPEEVEDAICVRVEEAVTGLPGIKRIRSTASEGSGTVTLELTAGEDVARRLADVRARIDAITTFPDEAEAPVVRQAELGNAVLSIAVSGATDERTLKRYGEKIRDQLVALPEVTEVGLNAVRPYEVAIEVSKSTLEQYGLGFDEVAQAVQRSSLDLPGGSVRSPEGEILLRATGEANDAGAFAAIALTTQPDGTRLTVGDVAEVIDGFAETDQRASFDGRPAILLTVFRMGDQKALEVAEAAEAYVERARAEAPEGLEITVWQNVADHLGDRIGSMVRNGRGGLLLVLGVLALFLRLRLAFWVSAGIPTAFAGAVLLMPTLGLTVNWISLLGFIVVLGIVVDDAIVVGENAHTEQEKTGQKLEGAIRGAQGIAVPVFFGVATTIAAFAPMLFIPGNMGRLTRVLPLIVIACLVFSVIEAMFILPAHLGHGKAALDAEPRFVLTRWWRGIQKRVAAGLQSLIDDAYRPALDWALSWRYLTLAIGSALFLITCGLLAGGWLRFTFQEPVEGDIIIADLTMLPGTSAHVTAAALAQLEHAAREVQAETDAERDAQVPSIFHHILTSAGQQPFREAQSQMPGPSHGRVVGSGAHLGEVQVEMAVPEYRDFGTDEMMRRWRERVGPLPGVSELSFVNTMISSGKPIELELRGDDLADLRATAAELRERIVTYPGVFDVADSFRSGKQELRFSLLPQAESLGLSLADVGRQVRQAFFGEEVQRIQRGRDDVPVMVRYPAEERRSLGEVESMGVRTRGGELVPFRSVARVEMGEGYASIQRVDRRRAVTVTADVDAALGNANEIVADLEGTVLPEILANHPGVSFAHAGEQAQQRDFLDAMLRGQVLALLAIYALLAIPLRSYITPLVIMTAIPFGLVGAAAGHLLLGYDFSMYSVIGFVALSGVVVNASLVLVDRVNQLREQGERLTDAVREAGRARLRPILLTSLTTFVGLTPMMLERSMSARFMIPMAISLAFGVIFSSLVTLFIVPCSYLILEDANLLIQGQRRRRGAERIAAAAREQAARDAEGTSAAGSAVGSAQRG